MSETTDDDIEDSSAPLIEHLAELRTRLIRSVIALLIAICVFFIPVEGDFIAEHILEFMLRPIEQTLRALGDPSPTLQYTSPQEYLFTLEPVFTSALMHRIEVLNKTLSDLDKEQRQLNRLGLK